MEPSRDRRASPVGRLPRRRTDRVEDAAAWLLATIALFVLLLAIWVAPLSMPTHSTRAGSSMGNGRRSRLYC